jgi:hypothetical protein
MRDAISGACLCGAVTFEVAPPYRWFAHCHCSMCRKHHGTLFGTTVGVARTRFRWLSHFRGRSAVAAARSCRRHRTMPER